MSESIDSLTLLHVENECCLLLIRATRECFETQTATLGMPLLKYLLQFRHCSLPSERVFRGLSQKGQTSIMDRRAEVPAALVIPIAPASLRIMLRCPRR